MSAVKNDWTIFTKRIPIRAEVQEIYNAWASQDALEKWFLRSAEFFDSENRLKDRFSQIKKGDSFIWKWFGYGDETVEKNKVLEANGKDFLQFGFAGDCIVSVTVRTEEEEQVVELTQENIPLNDNPETNLLVGCGEGWTFYLANLKSYLEGGLDLRNKNEKIKKVISS